MPTYVKAVTRVLPLCILFCCVSYVRASTFIVPADGDLIIGARAVVRGKVLSISCQLDEQTGRVFTYVGLRVQEVLKGQIAEREIVLKEQGGQVGNRGSIVWGTPHFQTGERVLVYLDTWRDGSLRVYQMFLGKFSIIEDAATGERIVVRDVPDNNTLVLQKETHSNAGGVATSRLELTAYREMLKKILRANRERSQRFDETYYRNTPMLAEPPEYGGIGGGELEPQFTLITQPPPRWFEPDSGQPVSFLVSLDGAPNAQVMDDVTAAMNAWSSVPGCSLRVNGSAAEVCYPRDLNTIVFNDCDGQFPPSEGCASIIALGGLNWDSDQRKVINGTTFVRANTGHISFNPYSSCSFGDHCSVQEVATHEMGHALGLGHSQFPDATMFGVAHFDGRCASIRQDDINAITFVYPATGAGPGPLTVLSTSPLGIATAGTAFSRQLLASGGTTPYNWSLVSGSLSAGLSLGSSGIISGTPTSIGTSDFTVKVTDAQNVSAQKTLSITVIAAATGYDSQFVSQNVPPKLNPGQAFSVTITWINNGSKPWEGAAGFAITSQNPPNNVIWGGDQIPWLNPAVAPGGQMDLRFQAFAPSSSGTYNFQWQLYQQGIGFFGQTSANVSITVGDPTPPPSPLSISSPSSLLAVKGTLFTYILTAAGGTPPYSWQVVTGTLPPGINLNPTTGALSGTPGTTGSSSVTVQATDSKSQAAQKALTITVADPPVEIVTSSLPAATKGAGFNQQLNATGGKPPYTWAVTAGVLPTGLSLAAATGAIFGTPSVTGSFSFTVTATDAESHAASRLLSITIAPPPLSMAAVPAIDGLKGSSFSYQLSATGGTPPYTWSITSGGLPSGLSLDSAGGVISGVPTVAGIFTLAVTVRDQASVNVTASIQIKLIDPETIPAITKVKYKGGNKLIVTGDRVNAAAVLLVDGNQVGSAPNERSFVVKPLVLASGRHEIRIVNPGAVSSAPVILTVE